MTISRLARIARRTRSGTLGDVPESVPREGTTLTEEEAQALARREAFYKVGFVGLLVTTTLGLTWVVYKQEKRR